MPKKIAKKNTQELAKNIPGKNLELRKPSELCQVLYYSDFSKQEFADLSALQLDLIGTMFFFVSDIMKKQQLTEEEVYEWASLNHFEINLQSISEILGKYENGFYAPIVKNLQELSTIQVLTNTLHKNKTQESTLFHFLRKISWTQDKQTTSKRVKVWIEPELLAMFLNTKSLYTKFALQIQFGLKSKYSKLLYELLKDYAGAGSKTVDFELLKAILNVDTVNKPKLNVWSNFNRDILSRSVSEINEKSDIIIISEPVKERLDKKLTVTRVTFTIKKQKSILIDYEEEMRQYELDTHIVSDNDIETKELTPEEIKIIQMAQKQMDKAIEFGSVIKNEQRYLEAIVRDLKKQNLAIADMIELDIILDELKSRFMDSKTSSNQLLVMENFSGHPVIAVSVNYLLYSPVDKSIITKTIKETINKINKFKKAGGTFKIIETNEKISELETSYL